MRVAIANWTARHVGGVESYIGTLARGLRRAGCEVCFVFETDEPASRGAIELPTDTRCWSVAQLGRSAVLSKLIEWRPDVVLCNGLLDVQLEAGLVRNFRSLLVAHNYYGTCISGLKTHQAPSPRPCSRRFDVSCLVQYFPRKCGSRSPSAFLNGFKAQLGRRNLLSSYRHILCASEHMRVEYERHDVPGGRVSVVPFPIDRVEPFAAPDVPRDPRIRILFIGRMEDYKGGRLLVGAAPLLAELVSRPVHLTFVGDGSQGHRWEGLTRALSGVTSEFPGWLSPEARNLHIASHDLLAVPSLWPEPFALVGPESGASGLPAAAFDVGGIREWLTDGENGALVRPGAPTPEGLAEAMARCVRDPQTHARLREGAVRLARRFTLDAHLSRLMPILARESGSSVSG